MYLNLEKWTQARISVEARIKALKHLIRTPGRGGEWDEYKMLRELKAEATTLYQIRASRRARIHQQWLTVYSPDRSTNTTMKTTEPRDMEHQQALILMWIEANPGQELLISSEAVQVAS